MHARIWHRMSRSNSATPSVRTSSRSRSSRSHGRAGSITKLLSKSCCRMAPGQLAEGRVLTHQASDEIELCRLLGQMPKVCEARSPSSKPAFTLFEPLLDCAVLECTVSSTLTNDPSTRNQTLDTKTSSHTLQHALSDRLAVVDGPLKKWTLEVGL